MAYSKEVVQRARARLAQAKEDRESENRQHLAEAYDRVPRLRQIDILLRRTMAMAAQAVFASGGDVQAAMAEAKQQNQALQQERAWLIDSNFEEGFLDETPICDRCGGTGYMGSQMCECLAELCRQEQKKELTLLSGGKESFNQFRLDYYPDRADPKLGVSPRAIMERNLRTCRTYTATFSQSSGNLLFNGGTGLGKTFLSACIARGVADKGYSVIYETATHLFNKLEQAKFNPSEETRQEAARFTACDLLIIDDLGTEFTNAFVASQLFSCISERGLNRHSTIISTNLSLREMQSRYSDRVFSRITSTYEICKLTGKDIRLQKRRRSRR